jgi:RNA-directed DNA polymerase
LSTHPEATISTTELHNQGTPQGGVISPLLVNIALNGMEDAVCQGKRNIKLIRYVDDVIVFSNNEKNIKEAAESLSNFLAPIGLKLSTSKTKISHTMCSKKLGTGSELEFLGYSFRNVETSIHRGVKNTRGNKQTFKQLSTPSQNSVQRHKANIKRMLKLYKNAPIEAVISRLTLIIKG